MDTIPQGWVSRKIGTVLKIGSGKDYKLLDKGDIPVYGTGGYMLSVNDFLYDGESVCIGRKGTINKPIFVDGKFWTVDTLFYSHSFRDAIPKYLFYLFSTINWMRYNEASGVPSLSKTTIESIKISLPLIDEQEKIVEILSIWDNVIKKQETLIKEKENLKLGLMQQLLTGQKRFNGFFEEWNKVSLGTIFKERSKRYKDLKAEEIEQYSELLSVGINSGVTKRSENNAKDNSSDDKSNYKVLKKHDIAYNTMRMWQGASGVSSFDGIVSPAYTVVYLKKGYDIIFFGYLFKYHRVVFDFYRYSQGLTSDTWNLKFPHFSEVTVRIPDSKEEQEKIASVLRCSEKEINLLRQELNELRSQKKGLMQKLLTGQIRVKGGEV